MNCCQLLRAVLWLLVLFAPLNFATARAEVVIRSNFPGGNALVEQNSGDTVRLAPDLRGGQPWFHWHFEAEAAGPGRITFLLANPPQIGVRGPAVSDDEGRTWRWLGTESVRFANPKSDDPQLAKTESFAFDFTAAKQRVRFAVSIPYVPHDLEAFLTKHASNPHLQRSVLARTRMGTEVDLLQVGERAEGRASVLVTARHHACEALASYVLEGWLEAAMSDSAAGSAFRQKYVLFAVPMVDRDGVQAGDQGKNRLPHDHNRDYGPMPIYPEIQAIQELAEQHDIRLALDLHCPALRGDIHEAFHFLGLGVPHVKENLDELIAWIGEERPPVAMAPVNFLTDPQKPNAIDRRINSHHFALRRGSLCAATLEIPYAQPNVRLDARLARQYGRGLLAAFVRTKFLTSDASEPRGAVGHAALARLRSEFAASYRGQPQANEDRLAAVLNDAQAPMVLRVEALNLMAALRLHQKRYADAVSLSDQVRHHAQATQRQRATALLRQLQARATDPASTPELVQAALVDSQLPDAALDHQAKALEYASDFYAQRRQFELALKLTRQRLAVAAVYEQGKVLNRIAALHDQLGQREQALEARRQAVKQLRSQLEPTPPRSIFGAMMTVELYEAVMSLPESTDAEKVAAAQKVLEHPISTAAMKKRVQPEGPRK